MVIMVECTYALVYIDGKRKLLKTKPHSSFDDNEVYYGLKRDLDQSGVKYEMLGKSSIPLTMADINKVEKLASKINPPVGSWFATNNSGEKHHFMKIIKKCGNPHPLQVYVSEPIYIVQEVQINLYSDRLLKSEGPGYDNYCWYLPDKKTDKTKTAYIRISSNGKITVNPSPAYWTSTEWKPWDNRKKEPVKVHTQYDPW